MRLGLVCPYHLAAPGGVQAQVLGLAGRLAAAGEEVLVIGPGLPDGVAGVDLGGSVGVPGNGSVAPISMDPRVGRRIREAAAEVDVLHVHEPLMPMVSLLAMYAGPPTVATLHAAPGGWARGLHRLSRPWWRRVLARAEVLTAVSTVAASVAPAGGEVRIVPNGVDVAGFRPHREKVPGRVAFLGRDEPRKGLDVLLEAWPKVTAAVPEAELVVMGADRGGGDGVRWMGRVDDRAKIEQLGAAQVFVAPNLGGESFGIVLVEAMAAGCALVVSDLPAFRDVAGDAAVFVPPGHPATLAEAVIGLLADAEARASRVRSGHGRASRFDWPEVVSAYTALYREAAL